MNNSYLHPERVDKMPLLVNPKLLEVSVEPNTGYGSVAYDHKIYDEIGEIGNLGFGFFKEDLETLQKFHKENMPAQYYHQSDGTMDDIEFLKTDNGGIEIVYYDNINYSMDCRIILDKYHFDQLMEVMNSDDDQVFINKSFLYSSSEWMEDSL